MNENHDYALEHRLKELNPELHRRFTDAVFALQFNLSNYKLIFPEYTDHTNLHSLTVIDFCNQLIGRQLNRLNADEIYILLAACYFHDTGMGITRRDFEQFSERIDFGDYFDTHSRDNLPEIIRDFHNEFSGLFIQKYASLFEIPSPKHLWAIIQASRGHRRTDLKDQAQYPAALALDNGNTVCLPYLTALIRLADEIDVAASRNPLLLYDIEALTDEIEIFENNKLIAVKRLEVSEDAFALYVETSDRAILEGVRQVAVKMQRTLDYCRAVVADRTPFVITQSQVILRETQ